MDGQEWTDAIRYRIASGQVNVWAEAQRFDHGWGREFARAGTPAAELVSEIVQRLGLRLNYARVIGIITTIEQISIQFPLSVIGQ